MPVEKHVQHDKSLDASITYLASLGYDESGRPDLHISAPTVYNLPYHRKGEGFMGGSIIHDKRSNKWSISVYWEGARYRIYTHPVTHEPFLSYKSAQKQLAKIQTEIDECSFNPNAWLPDSPLSTRAYCEDWLKIVDVLPKTMHCYRPAVMQHIGPFFLDKDIRNIRYNDIVKFKNHLTEKGLSTKSVSTYVGVLKKILHDAWRNQDIMSVPPFPALSAPAPEIVYLIQEQQEQMIEAIPAYDRPIFQFMMEYGLRPQEARALQKDCIENGQVTIRRSFSYQPGGGEILRETTKTGDKGKRTLGLTTTAKAVLQGITPHLSPFVFVRRDGMPYRHRNIQKIWHRAEGKTGIICKLTNACRHSLGCQLLDMGIDEGTVQQIYGHTDRKMTKRYAKRAIATITEALEARGKAKILTVYPQSKK